MPDITLNCCDCPNPFIWTEGEQAFFQSKGLTEQPKRCKECRAKKKAQREQQAARPAPVPEPPRYDDDRRKKGGNGINDRRREGGRQKGGW